MIEGGADEVRGDERPRVLVLCTGNLCRSPLVAALLERALGERDIDVEIASAGTGAPDGAQPDRKLLRVAGDLDLELFEHRSRQVTYGDIRGSDLIVVMTGEHAEEVVDVDKSAAERVVPLRVAAWRSASLRGRRLPFSEWVRLLTVQDPDRRASPNDWGNDVSDPIGGPLRGYRKMADEVDHLVEQLAAGWSGT